MSYHPTAIISEGARIGRGVTVGRYAVIEAETEIGDDNQIAAHAVIKRDTTLGRSNIVHEGAVLGGEPQDLGFTECESYLRIGSGNHIREGVTIHRGTTAGSTTTVGSGCFIMANAHVAHDCHLGDRVILANNVALAGHVTIEDRAFLSGGVVVHQFCRIGRLAMIGGNAKIVQDCLPFVITDGMLGRARGLNLVGLRRAGHTGSDVGGLKQSYRILLRSGLALEDAVARTAEMRDPLVEHLLRFIKSSRRGFCHE